MKPTEFIYSKYSYLAERYAKKVFQSEKVSLEFEDLLQEFRLKIFTSIKAYGRRWAKYRKGEATRPIPLKSYLEACCANRMRDLVKEIQLHLTSVSVEDVSFDYAVCQDVRIEPDNDVYDIGGIDLLQGLREETTRKIFGLYLKGYDVIRISKEHAGGMSVARVKNVIDEQRARLIRSYGNDLLRNQTVYKVYSMRDDDEI